MHRAPHERLRSLREEKGFRGQKHFCAHAARAGYRIDVRRYGAIERGAIRPTQDDIINICKAMEISADAWLFGKIQPIDLATLSEREAGFVRQVVIGLKDLKKNDCFCERVN